MLSRDLIFAAATIAILAGIGLVSEPFAATSPTLNRMSSVAGTMLIGAGIIISAVMILWVVFEKPAARMEDDPLEEQSADD